MHAMGSGAATPDQLCSIGAWTRAPCGEGRGTRLCAWHRGEEEGDGCVWWPGRLGSLASKGERQGQTPKPSHHMHPSAYRGLRNRRTCRVPLPAGPCGAAWLLAASASLASRRIRCCSRRGLAGASTSIGPSSSTGLGISNAGAPARRGAATAAAAASAATFLPLAQARALRVQTQFSAPASS